MTLSQRTFVAMPDHPGDNGGNVLVLDPDGDINAKDLELRLDLYNHSPTGFAWGYNGSGPAQLALGILAEVVGDTVALELHHQFKDEVIAGKPKATWSISEEYVRGWLEGTTGQDLRFDIGTGEDWMPVGPAIEALEIAEDALEINNPDGIDPVLLLELLKNGYQDVREVGDRGLCGVSRFMYTCGVCYGLDETGYAGRFCFDTMANAQLFLIDWDGTTAPTIGLDGCTAIK